MGFANRQKGIYGVGINDLPYDVAEHIIVDGKIKVVWRCPFYARWHSMMARSYSKKYKISGVTYSEAAVSEEWKSSSAFKVWMENQHWEGMHLDKDILFPGNKEYSPDKCCLVPRYINNLLTDHRNDRGDCPLGTNWHGATQKYSSQISLFGKRKHLGVFTTKIEAHKAWQEAKASAIEDYVAHWSASGCKSFRSDVAAALIKRAWDIRLQSFNGQETKNFQ